jgi:hypothetical protein
LERLIAYEIRQASHVAMADPEQIARRLADKIQHTDADLEGGGASVSAADRAEMVAAVRREIDRVINGTISRLTSHT